MSPLAGKGTWCLLPTTPSMLPTATEQFDRAAWKCIHSFTGHQNDKPGIPFSLMDVQIWMHNMGRGAVTSIVISAVDFCYKYLVSFPLCRNICL